MISIEINSSDPLQLYFESCSKRDETERERRRTARYKIGRGGKHDDDDTLLDDMDKNDDDGGMVWYLSLLEHLYLIKSELYKFY